LSLESKGGEGIGGHARLFVAIPVPVGVRVALQQVQSELKEILPRSAAAWARLDGMHLTLRFLGNVAVTQIPGLSDRLRAAVAEVDELTLVCERLGCFPDLRYPRVVWAWVHDEADALARLFQRVDDAVSEFAEQPAEKRFTGHITLARLKQIKRPDAEQLAAFINGAVQREFGHWTAKSVSLIQSQLNQAGATYTELCCANLR
jgi:RNA 2',3'-cyclic 3'-phosphodiesterase